jgi:hypothetical protein
MILTNTWAFPVVPPDKPLLNAPEGSGGVALNAQAATDWHDKELTHRCLDEEQPPEAASSHPPSGVPGAAVGDAVERIQPAMPTPDSERAPLLRASRFGHRVTPLK